MCVYLRQASLFFNGNGSGEGSHVSIYIKILPGEYDALLKWPFAHTVSFSLYDQAINPDKVTFFIHLPPSIVISSIYATSI